MHLFANKNDERSRSWRRRPDGNRARIVLIFGATLSMFALVALVPGCGGPDTEAVTTTGVDLTGKARQLVDDLAARRFQDATTDFDQTMRTALPVDKLRAAWESIAGQVGAFQRIDGVRTETSSPYRIVNVACRFERANIEAKVVFDSASRVAGFFFLPAQGSGNQSSAYQTPSYVRKDAFREQQVTVGSGKWTLPGTLSLPVSGASLAAVVLVHGSGPQDRDETIGPTNPSKIWPTALPLRGLRFFATRSAPRCTQRTLGPR